MVGGTLSLNNQPWQENRAVQDQSLVIRSDHAPAAPALTAMYSRCMQARMDVVLPPLPEPMDIGLDESIATGRLAGAGQRCHVHWHGLLRHSACPARQTTSVGSADKAAGRCASAGSNVA